jgi:Ca2+-binding EF-hand superfamily protein
MLFKDSNLLDRIFTVFDSDNDGFVNFREYVQNLSILSSKAGREDKLKCNDAYLLN